jgi:hypothetical protein
MSRAATAREPYADALAAVEDVPTTPVSQKKKKKRALRASAPASAIDESGTKKRKVATSKKGTRPSILTTASVRKRASATSKKKKLEQQLEAEGKDRPFDPANPPTALELIEKYNISLAEIALETTEYLRHCFTCNTPVWISRYNRVRECTNPNCRVPFLVKLRQTGFESYDPDC